MYNLRFTILRLMPIVVLLNILFWNDFSFAETKPKSKSTKTVKKTTVRLKAINKPLPHLIFFQLIDSVDLFSINHSTQFKHIDVPKRLYDKFNAFIKDSTVNEVSGLESLLYYNYALLNGKIIIGDIYFNEKASYIVFKIYDKKYVNYFSKEGVQELKTYFKL